MALVKMTRAVPEVTGGKTTCEIPEDAVEAAIRNGWSIAKSSSKEDEKEDKVETTKTETIKEEVKEVSKKSASKGKSLRDE